MNIINNSQIIGSLSKDLVLNTLGKVYIRTGDRYHELDFKKTLQENHDVEVQEVISDVHESDVIIVNSISGLSYPGDNKLIVSIDGKFYITINGKFKHINKTNNESSETKTDNSLLEDDIYYLNKIYSDYLIVDFESGTITSHDISTKNLKVDKINNISTNSLFGNRFVKGSSKMYIGPEIRVNRVFQDLEFTYFFVDNIPDIELFPVDEIITDDKEIFEAKIIEVTESYIKTIILEDKESGLTPTYDDIEYTEFVMIKGDVIKYDPKWQSVYDKKYYIRSEHIYKSGKYYDLEFITVDSDLQLELRAGTLIKCENNCNISVVINDILNTYELYENNLYIIEENSCYNITQQVRYFKTKNEYTLSHKNDLDISFIEETGRIYYKNKIFGLPENFDIFNPSGGAVIRYDGYAWKPYYEYATEEYVNDVYNELSNEIIYIKNKLAELDNVKKELEDAKSRIQILENKLNES